MAEFQPETTREGITESVPDNAQEDDLVTRRLSLDNLNNTTGLPYVPPAPS